ncbi:MAG: type II toxin-antitoxin system PemK/MazF family toxin, partial [Anaerolineales bacterium]
MQKGDIINVTLPNQGGHEQRGERPGIAIVSKRMVAEMGLLLVVPITAELKQLRFPHTFRVEP